MPGSATMVVARLDGETGTLDVCNLGDAGLRVLREGRVVATTQDQQVRSRGVAERASRYAYVQRMGVAITSNRGFDARGVAGGPTGQQRIDGCEATCVHTRLPPGGVKGWRTCPHA